MDILKKFNFNDRKNILLGVLVVGVISMTVAFATLSTNLRINGTVNVAATRWNIHFDNWTMAKPNINVAGVANTATQTKAATLSPVTNTTLINGLEVNLAQPGDTMSYTFDVVNDGTIDAKLDNFDAGITSASSTSDLEYTVVCGEQAIKGSQVLGNTPSTPEVTDELDAGKARACKLTITYKEATNAHIAGQNQVYSNPTARSITMHAGWTWSQKNGGSSEVVSPINSTQESGNFIKGGTTGWKLLNPDVQDITQQNYEYWTTTTEKIMSGWHELEDYYGNKQEYYFENGLAYKGWLEYNGKNYYLSTFDTDGNGYVNCDLIRNTTMEIDGQCYEFSSTGVATESNACSTPTPSNIAYQYIDFPEVDYVDTDSIEGLDIINWLEIEGDTKRVCVYSKGTKICATPGPWDCGSVVNGQCSNQNSQVARVMNAFAQSDPDSSCKIYGNRLECYGSRIPDFHGADYFNPGLVIDGDSGYAAASGVYEYSVYSDGYVGYPALDG